MKIPKNLKICVKIFTLIKIKKLKTNNKGNSMFIVVEQKLTPELCKQNRDTLFVFGDNMIRKGKAGQAIIRDEPNAFGIPTKRLPSIEEGSFFSDKEEECRIVIDSLVYLWDLHKNDKKIALPINPIGSGLARLYEKSPKIWSYIESFYRAAYDEMR